MASETPLRAYLLCRATEKARLPSQASMTEDRAGSASGAGQGDRAWRRGVRSLEPEFQAADKQDRTDESLSTSRRYILRLQLVLHHRRP